MFGFGKKDNRTRRSEAVAAAYHFIERASPEVVLNILNLVGRTALPKGDLQWAQAEQQGHLVVEAAKERGRGSEPDKELRKMALSYWAMYLAHASMDDVEDKRALFERRLKEIS
jgi:hypothetical protein